jgi:hypothetical protein
MTQILQNHTHSPLIGIIVEEKGKEVVRYFTDEKTAEAAVSQQTTQDTFSVIGAGMTLIGKRRWQRLTASGMRASLPHPFTPPIKV